MQSTIQILESIKDFIAQNIDFVTVELTPDDISSYFLRDANGAILIQYQGSSFTANSALSVLEQNREIEIALLVIARSQLNEHGALEILDKLRSLLLGFSPDGCTPLTLKKEQFAGENEGLWQFELVLSTKTKTVQELCAKDKALGALFVETIRRY